MVVPTRARGSPLAAPHSGRAIVAAPALFCLPGMLTSWDRGVGGARGPGWSQNGANALHAQGYSNEHMSPHPGACSGAVYLHPSPYLAP